VILSQDLADLLGVPVVGFADTESLHLRAYMTTYERRLFEGRLESLLGSPYTFTTGSIDAGGTATPVRLHGVLRIGNVTAQVWEVRENYAAEIEAIHAALDRARAEGGGGR
jgi:hypothetical protein